MSWRVGRVFDGQASWSQFPSWIQVPSGRVRACAPMRAREVLLVAGVAEVHGEEAEAAAQEVHVRVVEAGHDQAAVQVHDRAWPVRSRTARRHRCPRRTRGRPSPRSRSPRAGPSPPIRVPVQDELGVGRRRRLTRHESRRQPQPCEPPHSYHLEDHHRHVVVLGRVADEAADRGQDAVLQDGRLFPSLPADSMTSRRRRSPNSSARPFMASERPSVKNRNMSPLRRGTSASSRIWSKRAPAVDAEAEPRGVEHARRARCRPRDGSSDCGRRARSAWCWVGRVHHGVGHGDERPRVEGGGQDAVGLDEEPRGRIVDPREARARGPSAPPCRGRPTSLPGHVRHQHAHARAARGRRS